MTDLSVKYMGLNLKNPIIVASSGLTNSIEKIKDLASNGAAAVILKSLFEEQIMSESDHHVKNDESYGYDVHDYITRYTRDNTLGNYLNLIKEAKDSVDIPIIASINCISSEEWIDFAKKIEEAGADALEINISLLPSDPEKTSEESEKIYFDILEKVKNTVSIPIAVKMSPYSAGLANLIRKISWSGFVDAIVLFNRYYSPDIDIDKMKITSTNVFSSAEEISTSLRWVALISKKLDTDLAATTGIHDGKGVIKQILAGAQATQVASAIYQNGSSHIQAMLHEIEMWMEKNNYKTIDAFRGKMSYDSDQNNAAFERIQFMKHFGGIE